MVGNQVHLIMQKCLSCNVYRSLSAQNLNALIKVLKTINAQILPSLILNVGKVMSF